MRVIKICFLMGNIFKLGGVQRVTSIIVNELAKEHEVHIMNTTGSRNNNVYDIDNNVKIHILTNMFDKKIINKILCKTIVEINGKTKLLDNKITEDLLVYGYYPHIVRDRFVNKLNEQNFDIIIGVEGYYALLLGAISNRLKAKTIGWLHNSYDAYFNTPYKYYWKQKRIFKRYLSKLDECLVLTNSDKELYKNQLDLNCTVMYNPLSFNSTKKSLCTKKNIIFVGRLVKEQKGLDLLIDAFEIINSNKPEWNLIIVGDGEDREEIEQYIKRKKLGDNIELVGSTDKVEQYYLNSSIFVSSSRWEGFGLVITEAMECGLPVVAFYNSGPSEIISKNLINGILVERQNVKKLAEEIVYLIENPDIRNKISQEAIKRAQDFKIENIILKWNDIFNYLRKFN